MKVLVHTGPMVGDLNAGFSINSEHARMLSNTLWEWLLSLPLCVRTCIKSVAVVPRRLEGDVGIVGIQLEVGDHYERITQKRPEKRQWKVETSCDLQYISGRLNQPFDFDNVGGNGESLKDTLRRQICTELRYEARATKNLIKNLDTLLDDLGKTP